MNHYILIDRKPVAIDSTIAWAAWFDVLENRLVGVTGCSGGRRVSTVFLGIDHGFSVRPPLFFETMVFDKAGQCEDSRRYATWEEAEAGHALMVAKFGPSDEN